MVDSRWDSLMPQNAEEVCVAPPWLYQRFKTPLVPLTLAQLLAFWMNTCSKAPCSFQCSIWKRLMIAMREAPLEAQCLGSLLFSQPALLWVLPAGWHELAVTFLNLDASSMETYDICFFFLCLSRAMFSIAQIQTIASSSYAHRATHSLPKHPFVAWGWALGAQDLSYEWFRLSLCLFVYLIRNQDV